MHPQDPDPLPTPLRDFSAPTDLEAELSAHVALLEAMFDDPQLRGLRRRRPDHPAVVRYDGLMAGRETPSDEDVELGRAQIVAQGLLDRMTWANDPHVRPFWPSTVPDANQAQQVRRRIEDSGQYGDTTLELFVWGALRLAGIPADLQERDGEPDIQLPDPSNVGWLEVKRIHAGTSPTRARDVLAKAARQIKKVSPGKAGAVYLLVEAAGEVAALDDRVPEEVDRYVAEALRTLGSSDDKHVGQVIVGWDDFLVLGHFPDPVMYAIRRRVLVLDRANAISGPLRSDWGNVFGFTTVLWIRPSTPSTGRPRPLVTDGLVLNDQFQHRNNWAGGIRATHVRRVIASPDGLIEVPVADGTMSVVLVTKRIDVTDPPHVMLLIGFKRVGQTLSITDGFRLRGSEAQLEAWRSDPSVAFDELIERYGLPTSIGLAPPQLFHMHVEAPSPFAIAVPGADDKDFFVTASVQQSAGRWTADWVYAVDDGAYRASLGFQLASHLVPIRPPFGTRAAHDGSLVSDSSSGPNEPLLRPRRRLGSLCTVAAPKTVLPDLDLARIRRYCEGRVRTRLRDQSRIELDMHSRSVTILECRPPWTPEIGPQWTRFPIAQLR